MDRRKFFKYLFAAVSGLTLLAATQLLSVRKIFYRLRHRLSPPAEPRPEQERIETVLDPAGPGISVETALNSRCNSDEDGDQMVFHWGLFDPERKLSPDQIDKIVQSAAVLNLSGRRVEFRYEGNLITFLVDRSLSGRDRDRAMVESGLQQQAVGLVCAALGVGHVFRSMGMEGKEISQGDLGAVQVRLGAMKPSYGGNYWTTAIPSGLGCWKKDNLPAPVREGTKPLLEALKDLTVENTQGRGAALSDLSQLLWAARGRTPHLVKSEPRGLTIPTNRGEQHISSLYMISGPKLYKYENWKKGRPAHLLEPAGEIREGLRQKLHSSYQSLNGFIVINKNETKGRAFWEAGYQLLNLMVQAVALGLRYRVLLPDDEVEGWLKEAGIPDPVAAFGVRLNEELNING